MTQTRRSPAPSSTAGPATITTPPQGNTDEPAVDVRSEAAEAAAAMSAAAHVERVARWERRRAWLAEEQAAHRERRRHGLRQRHARKLGGDG